MTQREDVRFDVDGVACAAWLYRPEATGPTPVIVMAHGLGGVREMRLDAFAERFVAAGYTCLVFDYRHFGASEGEPRELLSVRRQRADWRAAVAYARRLDGVDPARVVLWGTSFSGGHVLAIGAEDAGVAAVVSQCPFTDGLASTLAVPPLTSLRVTAKAIADVVSAVLRRRPRRVALAGRPGDVALMSAPDVVDGYLALVPEGSYYGDQITARVALDIVRSFPGRQARRLTCPTLVVECEHDTVAPVKATRRHVARAIRAGAPIEQAPVDAGHFDIYVGDDFEEVVALELAFLERHVPATTTV